MIKTINGEKIFYTDSKGNGQSVFFLHGWRQNSDCWNVPSAIKQKYRVITLDLPGHGKSTISRPYTLDDLAGLVISFALELKIEKPVMVCHSLAGEIATRILSYHPDFAKSLVFIAPTGCRAVTTLHRPRGFRSTLRKLFKRNRGEDMLHPDENIDKLLKQTYSNLKSEPSLGEYSKISLPLHLICGEKDTVVPLRLNRKLAKSVSNCNLYVMEQSGHFPFVEHRKVFYQVLDQILRKLTA